MKYIYVVSHWYNEGKKEGFVTPLLINSASSNWHFNNFQRPASKQSTRSCLDSRGRIAQPAEHVYLISAHLNAHFFTIFSRTKWMRYVRQ